MEWSGEASVIAQRKHAEHGLIVTVFARDIGRISGLVPGGASPKRAAMWQLGTRLSLRWRARVDGQLGTFTAEPARARPGLLTNGDALAGVNATAALLCFALPEHDPHPRLSDLTEALLDLMDEGQPWISTYLNWEMALLDEMGFGLDLSRCAVTGSPYGLAYVSPRSGRAVSAAAAGEWAPRLLPLSAILGGQGNGGYEDAFALTGYFLQSRLAEEHVGRPLPAARARLIARILAREDI